MAGDSEDDSGAGDVDAVGVSWRAVGKLYGEAVLARPDCGNCEAAIGLCGGGELLLRRGGGGNGYARGGDGLPGFGLHQAGQSRLLGAERRCGEECRQKQGSVKNREDPPPIFMRRAAQFSLRLNGLSGAFRMFSDLLAGVNLGALELCADRFSAPVLSKFATMSASAGSQRLRLESLRSRGVSGTPRN